MSHLTVESGVILLSEPVLNPKWYHKFCFGKSYLEMDCLRDIITIKEDDYEIKEIK